MVHPASLTGQPVRPTRTRYWVVVFAITLAVIQYIDRVCISQAAPGISAELGFSKEQMAWVFSAFTLAYALFEIPTGYWGDRRGPRRILLRVVTWWSFFTAATGWVRGIWSLVAVRFLFGAGEAGCFPNLTKAFERWLPGPELIRAQGVMWMSARWGGAITPGLVFLVLSLVHWRVAFALFGLLGIVWAVAFARWFRDNPREHPAVNAAEAALLPDPAGGATDQLAVPWSKLLRSRSVWCLCGQYFACSYAFYFFVTWFPTYLLEVQKFDVKTSALLAGLPLFVGGADSMVVGSLAPRLAAWTGRPALVRRAFGVGGSLGAALCLVLATRAQTPLVAVAFIAAVSFGNDIITPGAWTSCMDVGGRCVGTLSGMMNMVGNLGGFLSPLVLGYIVGATGNWNLTFFVTAGVYLVGALCWWLVDPGTPLEQQVRD